MTQTYDPYRLVDDVCTLLERQGLVPERQDQAGDRFVGACMLLRSLGVEPLMQPENALDLDGHHRYNTRVHGD